MILLATSVFAGSLVQPSVKPVDGPHYRAELAISDVEHRIRGQVTVTWRNPSDKPIAALPMIVHPNESPSGSMMFERLEVIKGPKGTFDAGPPSELLLTFATPLQPGETVEFVAAFNAPLQVLAADTNDLFAQGMSQLQGLQRGGGGGDFGLLAAGDGILVVASPFPMVVPWQGDAFAHRVLRPHQPVGDLAWNVPATFEVKVVTPSGLRVVTNLVDEVAAGAEGTQIVTAKGSHVAEFVLVASRDFVVAERKVGPVTVRSYALSRDRAAGASVLNTAVKSLAFLQRYGAYPFTELDIVEASLTGGAGGVEFGSLALVAGFLYRDPSENPLMAMLPMFGGGKGPGLDMTQQRDFVVAHEVAHQWSPGMVGANAWSHPIIDEPLAQYLALRILTEGQSAAAVEAMAGKNIFVNYGLYRLLGGRDAPADRETSGFATSLEYAALVYGKAPGLYTTLEQQVGRAALDKALAHAMKQHAWKTVQPSDWLASLQAGGATGATALGARWWSQGQGDVDLGIDAEGTRALEWMLGKDVASELTKMLAPLGMSPVMLFRTLLAGAVPGGAAPVAAPPVTVPGVDKLLEQLLK